MAFFGGCVFAIYRGNLKLRFGDLTGILRKGSAVSNLGNQLIYFDCAFHVFL